MSLPRKQAHFLSISHRKEMLNAANLPTPKPKRQTCHPPTMNRASLASGDCNRSAGYNGIENTLLAKLTRNHSTNSRRSLLLLISVSKHTSIH